MLTSAGLSEAITFGFIEKDAALAFAPSGDASEIVGVANPLSAKFDALRPSLLPGLLEAVAHNRRHGRRDVGLFEIGSRFTAGLGEVKAVAFAWTGSDGVEHWSGPGREVDFFDVKGDVELLCEALGSTVRLDDSRRAESLVPGQSASVDANGDVDRIPRAGDARRASNAPARHGRTRCSSPNWISIAWPRSRTTDEERVRPLAAVSVRRSRSLDSSSPSPCLPKSFVAPFRRPRDVAGRAARGDCVFRSVSGKGRAGWIGQRVGASDVSGGDRTLTDGEVQQAFDKILAALVHEARRRATVIFIAVTSMAKTATRSVELEPIDRLEEKVKRLVGLVDRMKAEQARRRKRISGSRASSRRCARGSRPARRSRPSCRRCATSATSFGRASAKCSSSSKR